MLRYSSIAFSIIALTLAFAECYPVSAAFANTAWQKSLEQGNNYLSKRAFIQAEQCFRLATRQADLVPHTAEDKSRCLNTLAHVLALEDKTSEAETILFQSLGVLEQAYGKSSPKLVPTLLTIGSIYESVGNHSLAMRFYSQAVSITELHYSPYCPAFSCNLPYWNPGKQIFNSDTTANTLLYGKPGRSALNQQAGLDASNELEKTLSMHDQDILKYECTSDQDLLSDFKREASSCSIDAAPSNFSSAGTASSSNEPALPLPDTKLKP
jgi:tetratricopeptide (TPR) repeat protein